MRWCLYQETYLDWFLARDVCIYKGGNLVAVRDAAAHASLVAFLANQGASVASAWIGLYAPGGPTTNQDLWLWNATGQTPVFKAWYPGQPDNWQGGQGQCAQVYGQSMAQPGTWDDLACMNILPYICETGEQSCLWYHIFGAPRVGLCKLCVAWLSRRWLGCPGQAHHDCS